ncbi:hypothetical protein IQ235_01605 [Oscillatoriales cyanobacterium LEGE 11467]|uniref:Uncharacterized protein n=1 Tax=Zarconia navalis LEGE 11467 TaxID=1828826 RepID=A0A928Z6H2_9CYAN|nr:hypothetical protein [Zarconia navalis]MBE9039490.1 hypothetical protein [Zarconia navalis LEGE 11467]
MSSTEKVGRIQVCFQISYHKWQLLQANWSDRGITETEMLNALIDRYLDSNPERLPRTPTTGSQPRRTQKLENAGDRDTTDPLHQYIDDRVGEILEQNLDSYLDRHFQEQIETILRDEISRHMDETHQGKSDDLQLPNSSKSQLKKERSISQSHWRSSRNSTELKTAKELAIILGCSPSYITTLNRIGELVKRGWKDSGKRQGKRILYQPVESVEA